MTDHGNTVHGGGSSDGLTPPPLTVILMEPFFPHTDDCCMCGVEVVIKCFCPNYGIPMYEGLPVPIDWTGEWGGFTACKACFDKYEAGELKTW